MHLKRICQTTDSVYMGTLTIATVRDLKVHGAILEIQPKVFIAGMLNSVRCKPMDFRLHRMGMIVRASSMNTHFSSIPKCNRGFNRRHWTSRCSCAFPRANGLTGPMCESRDVRK